MLSNLPQREEYLRKKRKRRLVKYGIVLLSVVLVVGLISYISYRPSIRISEIELSGGILVTQGELEPKALSFVHGSYFWLFPKNNVLWYPHELLSEYLSTAFRRIDTINIHLKNFHTLAVEITERKPVATWCEGEPSGSLTDREGGSAEDSNPKCYFMDQNSTIFSNAPTFSGDAYFKYYGFVASSSPIGKDYIASSTEFIGISSFVSRVKGLGLSPQYLVARNDNQFSMVLAGGGEILFDIKEPISMIEQNLEALLRTPALATSTRGTLPIEYIDLRYGNKLFYKLKQ
ncbi:MAG TPA: hypothetical protein VJG67_02210 [Candidatus Paceibacterota bacterium]